MTSRSTCFTFLILLAIAVPCVAAEDKPAPLSDANIHLRGSFRNARIRFEMEKIGHVAFLGGSITEMNGYRPMVMKILQRRFPETRFTFTDAGIASTCSTTGAFRLAAHVLAKGCVDLLFVEFAVNDDQDAQHAPRECIRGMEGVIRHTRLHHPAADVVMTYFVNPSMLETCSTGGTPASIAAHKKVAEHYAIPTIHLARETADQIKAGKLTWKQFGGTHPKPHGNAICAGMIDRLMTKAWDKPLPADARIAPYTMPKAPLDAGSYFGGRLIDPKTARLGEGATVGVPAWSKLKGSCRGRFVKQTVLSMTKPGADVSLDFEGTAVGAYVLAGPDAGIVEASIDGDDFTPTNLYHRFSRNLHYPRTVMFRADLKPGKHTLRLRLSSKGKVARILHFVVNQTCSYRESS